MWTCLQQTSSLITASSSLESCSHFSNCSTELISRVARSLKKGSRWSQSVTAKLSGRKCLTGLLISALYSMKEYFIFLISFWKRSWRLSPFSQARPFSFWRPAFFRSRFFSLLAAVFLLRLPRFRRLLLQGVLPGPVLRREVRRVLIRCRYFSGWRTI